MVAWKTYTNSILSEIVPTDEEDSNVEAVATNWDHETGPGVTGLRMRSRRMELNQDQILRSEKRLQDSYESTEKASKQVVYDSTMIILLLAAVLVLLLLLQWSWFSSLQGQ